VPLGWADGSSRPALAVVRSAVVNEAHISFNEWGSLVVRLWEGAEAVDLEWTVGPVPVDDGMGKEVALRVRSLIESGACLWNSSFFQLC
jgi:hypothetical protein